MENYFSCSSAEVSGHFGTSAEVSGHFGTGAEMSYGQFGTGAEVSWVRSVCTPIGSGQYINDRESL